MAKITENSFSQELQKMGLKVVSRKESDAQLWLTIKGFGFRAPSIFDKESPYLLVQADLVRNNKIIWSNKNTAFYADHTPEYSFHDLIQRPKNIQKGLQEAARGTAQKLLGKLYA